MTVTVTSMSPQQGTTGTIVTLGGTGFSTPVTEVLFPVLAGVDTYTPAGFTIVSDIQMTFTVPGPPGEGNYLRNGAVELNTASQFPAAVTSIFDITDSANPPTVSGFSPTSGVGLPLVTITGYGFTGATQVTFNGVPSPGFEFVSDSEILAYAPGTSGSTGPVAVTNAEGPGASSASFTWEARAAGPVAVFTVDRVLSRRAGPVAVFTVDLVLSRRAGPIATFTPDLAARRAGPIATFTPSLVVVNHMSSLNPGAVFSNPCRLVLNPTQPGLLLAYPHGGTPLGYIVRALHEVEEEVFELLSEARARRVAGGRGYTKTAFVFVLTQFDVNVLNNLYAYTTTSAGGYSGANTLTSPDVGASQQPGLVTPTAPLLVAPEDTSRPALLIYAPRWSQGGRKTIDYALGKGREEAVVVLCDDSADGKDYAVDCLENLSVT